MKRLIKIIGVIAGMFLIGAVTIGIYLYATALNPARPVGFQQIAVADPGHAKIPAAIWYPATARPGFVLLGSTGARLASDSPVDGGSHPLILISHGTGGSALSHADTAIALAEKGFIVIAPTHPGDNLQDDSDVGKPDWLSNRTRHVQRTIDAALESWSGRGHIDPQRIGVFGMSAGGTTALMTVGGKPDLGRVASHCAAQPEFVCKLMRASHEQAAAGQDQLADARIRAAVLAAPGLGFTFVPDGLADVSVPVQLWAGSADTTVPPATNAKLLAAALGPRAELHVVPGAGHLSFLMPCGLLGPPAFCRDGKGFDRNTFHRQFNKDVAEFFGAKLGGGKLPDPR